MTTSSSKIARRRGTVVTIALIVLALPGASRAATTVGHALTPTVACSAGSEYIQSISPTSPSYSVPSPGGVITSMSMTDSVSLSGTYDLKVYRNTSGTEYSVVGATGAHTVTPGSGLVTFPTRISVAAGDLLGLALGGTASLCGTNMTGFQTQSASGDQPPGASVDATTQTTSRQLNVQANLEPDSDADGFGDQTQDRCVGLYGSVAGCPKADLSVTNHPSAPRVEGGAYVSDILTVRNHGPDPVPDVVVDDAVGGEATVVAVNTTAGSCTLDQTVTCTLGGLASGASDIVVVTGRTTALGSLVSHADVTSHALTLAAANAAGAGDPKPSNNASTANTDVVSPPFNGVSIAPQHIVVGPHRRAGIVATSERTATGNLVLTATVGSGTRRGLHPRSILLGRASFTIGADQREVVQVRLSKSSLTELARSGRLSALVTARARDAFGSAMTTSAKVVVRRRRAKLRMRPFV